MDPQLTTPDSHDVGFSLIELMVAVAVLAVLSVGVSLSAGRGGSGQSDMQRFSQQFELVRALAIQGRQARGMRITPLGYSLSVLEGDGWSQQGQLRRWMGSVTLQVPLRTNIGAKSLNNPNVIVLPNGVVTDFTIWFRSDATGSVRCTYDGVTGLVCS